MTPWYILSLVTLLVLLVYFVLGIKVGFARGRFKIAAPAMTGHAEFERYVRVHYNTLEALVFFLPSMWFFAYFVDVSWASVLGVVWSLGRVVYALGYYKAADKRHLGTGLTNLPTVVAFVGAVIALVMKLAS